MLHILKNNLKLNSFSRSFTSLLIHSNSFNFATNSIQFTRNLSLNTYNKSYTFSANPNHITIRKMSASDSITQSSDPNILIKNNKQLIIEGSAHMEYDLREKVFYNKVQVFNRDISTQIIKEFTNILMKEREEKYLKKLEHYNNLLKDPTKLSKNNILKPPTKVDKNIEILDALAASGLRSIRYLNEIPLVSRVVINDILPEATDLAKENCNKNNISNIKYFPDINSYNKFSEENLPYKKRMEEEAAAAAAGTTYVEDDKEPEKEIHLVNSNASLLMYNNYNKYDIIDLDPYGSVMPFLDSAVQAIKSGGLLCVTCTDMTVLGGNYPEVALTKYNSISIKGDYVHEMSLRMLLHSISIAANKYKRYIVPLVSISVDFYVRVFVRVYESAQGVKENALNYGMIYQSTNSPTFYLQPLAYKNKKNNFYAATLSVPSVCEESESPLRIGGPYYFGKIHDQTFVDNLLKVIEGYDELKKDLIKNEKSILESKHEELKEINSILLNNNFSYYYENSTLFLKEHKFVIPSTLKRIKTFLSVVQDELKDVIFYYSLPQLASTINISCPKVEEFCSAILNGGYQYSYFHHEPMAIKTNAPNKFVSFFFNILFYLI